MDIETLKARIDAEVEGRRPLLTGLAGRIHAHPELSMEEHQAAAWLSEALAGEGFRVERGIADLPTAFRATYRPPGGPADHGPGGGPTIAILAEYDALPGVGHACGHNLICTGALGAAMALKAAWPDLPGTLVVLGTPGEEGAGGKVIMLERGAFQGIDAAMMFHPSSRTLVVRGATAVTPLTVRFKGKPAHAAGAPHEGINALEALILTFNGINALRQHLKDEVRIHGIITRGGDAPNVVPEFAEGRFLVRARTQKYLAEVFEKVCACARGAAAQTGAEVGLEKGLTYAERNNNTTMAGLFTANLARLGIESDPPMPDGGSGSSDIGNVSLAMPTIHPYVSVTDTPAAGHTHEFAAACRQPRAHAGMLAAAKALAATAADLFADPGRLEAARQGFAASLKRLGYA